MKKFVTLVLVSGAALSALALADGGDAAEGERLYLEHGCYTCHGYNGTGRRPLANNVSGITADATVFLTYLRARRDVKPMLPKQGMPYYSASSLPDDDALAILDYLRSLVDEPPAVESAPALRRARDSLPRPDDNQP